MFAVKEYQLCFKLLLQNTFFDNCCRKNLFANSILVLLINLVMSFMVNEVLDINILSKQ